MEDEGLLAMLWPSQGTPGARLKTEMPSPGVLFLSDLLKELQGHNMALFDLATGGVQTSNH